MACKYTYKGITYNSKEEFISQVVNSQILGKANVILPIGTSGSGKSTFIKSLPQENLVVIEPDAMRVEFTGDINNKSKDKEIYEEAAKRAIKAIKQGKQVVFDTTNLTKDKRLPFIEAIKKEIPTANIQYKLMELNPELAKQRIKAQIARGENRANVPDSTIDRHAESYKQMLEDIKSEPITPFLNKTPTKTRRILEVQSDLFQKGRELDVLIDGYIKNLPNEFVNDNYHLFKEGDKYFKSDKYVDKTEEVSFDYYSAAFYNQIRDRKVKSNNNDFLQLLNKDNNWVTFFIKSIIQDSAKKGYEKVLFPTGNTASKVEGHTTLEEFKKQKEDRIKELEEALKENENLKFEKVDEFDFEDDEYGNPVKQVHYTVAANTKRGRVYATSEEEIKESNYKLYNNEITQLKQELERVETEGFGALKPIYNFYENIVTNILKKQGYLSRVVVDEYNNTWNEVELDENKKQSISLTSKNFNNFVNETYEESIFSFLTEESDHREYFNNCK